MKLDSFHVWNFRSINDSGSIDVAQITALLGRNESGKSNLLLALKSLNPIDDFAALNAGRLTPTRPVQGLTIDQIGLMMGGAHAS